MIPQGKGRSVGRYTVIYLIIILMNLVLHSRDAAGNDRLYVFFPSRVPAASLQKKLLKGWPGIRIMVFGRFRDFKDRVEKDRPGGILTKPPVMETIGGYTVKLRGSRGGDTEESYILLSAGRPPDMNLLAGRDIGVFDILGRKGMKQFVGKYINPLPRLRRVSKMEDMLRLLTFNMIVAILIPENDLSYYQNISELDFTVTPLPGMKSGILALALKEQEENTPENMRIVSTLRSSEKQYLELLEVEEWK